MSRFLKIAAVYAFVLAVVGVPILFKAWLLPWWRDRPHASRPPMLLENTVYSLSFSESEFSKLRLGMSKDDVERIMGKPLTITRQSQDRIVDIQEWEDGSWQTKYSRRQELGSSIEIDSETYSYSRPDGGSDYWYARAVTFSSRGRVIEITKDYYEE